jgi:taurine dioxygenase
VLQLILDRYRKSEHQVRFQWKPGSIAFWDNRVAVHRAVRDYGDFPRHLERVRHRRRAALAQSSIAA